MLSLKALAKGALFLALCCCVCSPIAHASDNPYFDCSSYLKPTDAFVGSELLIDNQVVSDVGYAVNNVCYIPLRQVLTACGVDNSDIIWDSGTITVKLFTGTLELEVGSDSWMLDGVAHQTRNGHVKLQGSETHIPKDMIDEWRAAMNDPHLNRVEIRARYSPRGGGLIMY